MNDVLLLTALVSNTTLHSTQICLLKLKGNCTCKDTPSTYTERKQGAGNSDTLVVSSRSAGGLSAGNIHLLCDSGAVAGS
jgi:hypothetical protein